MNATEVVRVHFFRRPWRRERAEPVTWRRRLRAARRFPRRWLAAAGCDVVVWWTGCGLVEICVEVAGESTTRQGREWGVENVMAWALSRADHAGGFRVPVKSGASLADMLKGRRRRGPVRWVLRRLTRGRVAAGDQVEVVAGVLRAGGVDVPRSVVTVRRLFSWLTAEGPCFEYAGPITPAELAALKRRADERFAKRPTVEETIARVMGSYKR